MYTIGPHVKPEFKGARDSASGRRVVLAALHHEPLIEARRRVGGR
jgi:hypothetical protein